MKHMSWWVAIILILFVSLVGGLSSVTAAEPLVAAVFVQNRAGVELTDHVDSFKDFVTTRLTEKGFSIIDRDVAISRFREARSRDQVEIERIKTFINLLEQKNDTTIEEALDGASALRIAQMLGADYLVMASISSFGREVKEFKGYGVDNTNVEFRLRISLKVLEGRQGGTVFGDTITAKVTKNTGKNLKISSDDILPQLLDSGAQMLAQNVEDRLGRIRATQVKAASAVEFSVNSNVEAIVELDGAVIGTSPGRFYASPGLHQVRLTGQWLATWEKTVNIFANQTLNVTLQMSDEGQRRFASLEELKITLERERKDVELMTKERENRLLIDREQSEADAFAKKREAEGRKSMLEESRIRIEGAASQHQVDRSLDSSLNSNVGR